MSQVSLEDVRVQQCHEPITMVLLGINSENKCAIHSILQKDAEKEIHLKVKHVDDRWINIINTADNYHCLTPAPETFIQEELKPSYPGARLFLLVLQDNKISDDETAMVKKLKERFGEKIMKNTIVVMVEGEEPREQIDENLKNILEECSNTVYKKKQDTTEMFKELMKIWDTMQIHKSRNSASHSEHIYETILPVGEMNQTDESEGEDITVQQSHEPITIVLLGMRKKNKCMIGNIIVQEDWFGTNKENKTKPIQVDDRCIKVINTSEDFHLPIAELKPTSTEELKRSHSGPRLFLLVLQDDKVSDNELKMVNKLKGRFGEKMIKNTIVVMVSGEKKRSGEPVDENLQKVQEEFKYIVHKKKQDKKDNEMIKELMKTWDTMQKQIHASHAEHTYEMPDELELKNQTHESTGEDVCSPAGVYATVVLVGKNNSDKCLIGNTILRKAEFHSENDTYEIKTGKVQGQRVIIIKTPHPLHLDSKADSMEEMKPSYQGPRVFLLVLEENKVSNEREMIIELQGRFGKEMEKNTIVMVNNEKSSLHSFDMPGVNFEKTFLDECGNRICYYDKDIKHNDLVKDLMKYTEEIIQKNQPLRSGNENIDENDVKDCSVSVQHAANQSYRLNESTLCPNVAGFHEPHPAPMLVRDPYTTIVLLGQTGSGKSATGNTILGRQCFESRASSIPVTTVCQIEKDTVHRIKIRVIDTPDFFNEDLKNQADQLKTCKEFSKHGTVVYLLVMELGRFTDGEREVLPRFKKEFGEDVTTKTVILFTCKEKLKDKSLHDYIKETGQGLQELINSCQFRCCAFNNNKKGNSHQVKELLEIISQMQTDIPMTQHHHQHRERKNYKKESCRIL